MALLFPAAARADENLLPSARVGAGPAVPLAPSSDRDIALAVDATVGALYLYGKHDLHTSGVFLAAEAGYAHDGAQLHAGALMAGIGYGHVFAHVAWQPRLLVGSASHDAAIGMRNGVAANFLAALVSIEGGHQFVSYDGAIHHSIQLTLSLNPGMVIWALVRADRHD